MVMSFSLYITAQVGSLAIHLDSGPQKLFLCLCEQDIGGSLKTSLEQPNTNCQDKVKV